MDCPCRTRRTSSSLLSRLPKRKNGSFSLALHSLCARCLRILLHLLGSIVSSHFLSLPLHLPGYRELPLPTLPPSLITHSVLDMCTFSDPSLHSAIEAADFFSFPLYVLGGRGRHGDPVPWPLHQPRHLARL